jgi:hypothetical protein
MTCQFGWASGGEPVADGKEMPAITPGGVTSNNIVTGVAFKYVEVTQYEDFFNEYINGNDLTQNPATFPILNLFGVVPMPGFPAMYGTPAVAYSAQYPNGIPGTLREHGYEASWFFQDNIKVTNRFSILMGGRLDLIVTMLLMVLTSASDGLALGFITCVLMHLLTRRAKEIKPTAYALAGLFLLHYLFP